MNYDIKHITRDEILHGFADGYYCCMSGIANRKFQCDMWATVYDRVGSIGVLARTGDWIAGQLIYMPENFARRIGLPVGQNSDDMESTMVIQCVKVDDRLKNQGIASSMIGEAVDFCRQHEFEKVAAYVDPRTPLKAEMWVPSFSAFRRFGFVIDDSGTAWESKPDSRMCYLDL